MLINNASLKKIARSAKLNVTDQELDKMGIVELINFLSEIKNVDTTGVEPMFCLMNHDLPMREDIVKTGNLEEELLKNSPDKSGVKYGYFCVPRVIGDEE